MGGTADARDRGAAYFAGPFEVIVRFDEPVNVSRSELLGPIWRQRVTATVDHRGISLAYTGGAQPQLRVRKI